MRTRIKRIAVRLTAALKCIAPGNFILVHGIKETVRDGEAGRRISVIHRTEYDAGSDYMSLIGAAELTKQLANGELSRAKRRVMVEMLSENGGVARRFHGEIDLPIRPGDYVEMQGEEHVIISVCETIAMPGDDHLLIHTKPVTVVTVAPKRCAKEPQTKNDKK